MHDKQRAEQVGEQTAERVEQDRDVRRSSSRLAAQSPAHAARAAKQLQRRRGNAAVARMVQAKLVVTQPGDRYEQEADRAAAQAIGVSLAAAPPGALQRQALSPVSPGVTADPGVAVTPNLEAGIETARGGGQPLPDTLRRQMEVSLGADFTGVRVHTGAQAHALNEALEAQAFTTGRDIFFRQGEYQPSHAGGQALLAHELAHVVQQRQGGQVVQRSLSIEDTPIHWEDVVSITASVEGAEGVLFVRDTQTNTLVVKFAQSPVGLLLAQHQLQRVGVRQPRLRVIPIASDEGKRVFDMLKGKPPGENKSFLDRAKDHFTETHQRAGFQNTDAVQIAQKQYTRLQSAANNYTASRYIIVQEYLSGAVGLDDAPGKPDRVNIVNFLNNEQNLNMIGRVLAVDALIGNEDRFLKQESMSGMKANLGNIMIRGANELFAIDNAARLFPFQPHSTDREWLAFVAKGGKGPKNTFASLTTPLFNPQKFARQVVDDLQADFSKQYGANDAVWSSLQQVRWQEMAPRIAKGIIDARTILLGEQITTENELVRLQATYPSHATTEVNADPTAFRMRSLYVSTRYAGIEEEKALQLLENYLSGTRLLNAGLQVFPDALNAAVERPKDPNIAVSGLRMFERGAHSMLGLVAPSSREITAQADRSEALKAKARHEGLTRAEQVEAIERGNQPNADRRDKKAAFEARVDSLFDLLQTYSTQLQQWHQIVKHFAELRRTTIGTMPNVLANELRTFKMRINSPEYAQVQQSYRTAVDRYSGELEAGERRKRLLSVALHLDTQFTILRETLNTINP
jgi:hypothetical protein